MEADYRSIFYAAAGKISPAGGFGGPINAPSCNHEMLEQRYVRFFDNKDAAIRSPASEAAIRIAAGAGKLLFPR